MLYYEKYGCFPGEALNKKLGQVLQKLYEDPAYRKQILSQLTDEFAAKIPTDREVIIKSITAAAKTGTKTGTGHILGALVAKETVKASLGGGTSLAGRRAAIVAIETTAARSAAQGGFVALKSTRVNIAATVAEFGTEQLMA